MLPVPRILCLALLVAGPLIGLPGISAADPTADDIINALKPNSGALNGPTRGIRAVAPTPTQTPTAGQPVRQPAESSAPSLDLTVQFQSGSAELTPAAAQLLDRLGRALASPQLAADHFRIEGHTDNVGSPEINKPLSQRRAEKVASYLEMKFGIEASRLEPVGVGEDDLLVPTPPQTAEPRNRRVHVVNLSG